MKHAYSNIFGLVVDATEVDHKDCEPFQIVCRECREYVFKTVRNHPNGPIHYFSHYRADPEANALCEERAKARLQNGGYSSSEGEGRDQTMELYLASFTEMINSLPHFKNAEEHARIRSLVNSSKGACNLRNQLRQGLILFPDHHEMIREVAYGDPEQNDEGIFGRWDENNGWNPETQFARSVQVRIAADMLKTLLTKLAIPAWNTLFASAWILTTAVGAKDDPNGPYGDYTQIVIPVMSKACNGEDIRQEIDQLSRKRCGLPYLIHGGSWLDKLQIEVMDNIFSILLSIDYARWSRQRETGKAPKEISAELRLKALKDYERQKQALISAGLDVNPPNSDEITREAAKKTADLGNQITQAEAVLHRSMTGEGRKFRYKVEAPSDDAIAEGMMLMVRPRSPGNDIEEIQGAIRRQWPSCVSIDTSDTGVPNCQLHWKGDYKALAERLSAIASNDKVEEATAMFIIGSQGYALTITEGEHIVEKVGKPMAA